MNIFRRFRRPAAITAAIAGVISAMLVVPAISTAATPQAAVASPNVSSQPFAQLDAGGDSVGSDVQDYQKPGYQGLVASGGLHVQAINPGSPATVYSAKHVVVVNSATGKVVWGGNMGATVRDVKFCGNDKLYVAGDFTTVNGTARKFLARFNYTGSTFTFDSSWKPVSPGLIYAIGCVDGVVFFTGETQGVYAVNDTNGAAINGWAGRTNGFLSFGPKLGRSLKVVDDSLYIGGNFINIGNGTTLDTNLFRRPGAAKVSIVTGQVDPGFYADAIVAPDSLGKGGETIISIESDPTHNQLVVGGAGEGRNAVRVLNLNTGKQVWGYDNLYGDTQALAVVTWPERPGFSALFIGFHWNTTKNPVSPSKPGVCKYHAEFDLGRSSENNQNLIGMNGQCADWWDPKFEGAVTNNPSRGNGGVQSIVFDPGTGKLIYGGQFRKVNGLAQAGLAMFNRPELPQGVGVPPTPTPTPTETPTETPTTCPVPAAV